MIHLSGKRSLSVINGTLTTCTVILNKIDSRSKLRGIKPYFLIDKRFIAEKIMTLIISLIGWVTHMYGIAITYAVVSLLLLGCFAYLTFKMTSKR